MDDAETDVSLDNTPSLVVEGLKCPVCWDYFEKPHTLGCGHTFCLRCLQNLARITRSSKTRTPLDRLRMCCPACRKRTLVRPILKRRASLNYAMKQIISDWQESPLSSGQLVSMTLRSIGSQTETENFQIVDKGPQNVINDLNKNEESEHHDDDGDDGNETKEDISEPEVQEVTLFSLNCHSKSEIKIVENSTDADVNADDILSNEADDQTGVSDDNQASSSDDESEQDIQIGPMFARLVDDDERLGFRRRLRRFTVTSVSGVLAMLFLEISAIYNRIRYSRSRLILTLFWFCYGGVVVYMSRAFLPWMTFYTVIYFIIIYVEVSQGHILRQEII
ncbi:hypothetical protein ACF0H5_015171 [Mactra antiquata]